MEKRQDILIANTDLEETTLLADLIHSAGYRSRACGSLTDLNKALSDSPFLAVVLDIDSLDIDNRTIRRLTSAYPDVCFLSTSRGRFHPELQEAMRDHIFASITKPVDPDEVAYWIRCIRDHQEESRDPPDNQTEKGA